MPRAARPLAQRLGLRGWGLGRGGRPRGRPGAPTSARAEARAEARARAFVAHVGLVSLDMKSVPGYVSGDEAINLDGRLSDWFGYLGPGYWRRLPQAHRREFGRREEFSGGQG